MGNATGGRSQPRFEEGWIIVTFGAVVLGILYCFVGSRLTAWLFLMNGFLISFAVALSPILHLRTGFATLLGVGGGIALAILFGSAARISHFIMGAVLGAVIGALIDPVAMLVLAGVGGIAAVVFKKPMLIISTSVTGAFLIAASIEAWVLGRSFGGMLVARAFSGVGGGEPILSQQAIGAFVFLALAGLLVQSLSGRLKRLADEARHGPQRPEEQPSVRSLSRRPSTVPLKPSTDTNVKDPGAVSSVASEEPEDPETAVPEDDSEAHVPFEEPGAPEPEETVGEHHATWTEDVDLPGDPLHQEDVIEAVLAWERTTPIALAALARFVDATGRVRARALAVRQGLAPDHRLVSGAFQRDLGLGDLLVSPVLLDGMQGRILVEFTEGIPSEEPSPEKPMDAWRDRPMSVSRDTFRLSDRRPTREQIIEGLLRWERPQAGYEVVIVTVLNIQDEPIARALVVAKDLGVPVAALTEGAQREMGIASPVTGFFEVEGADGILLVEI